MNNSPLLRLLKKRNTHKVAGQGGQSLTLGMALALVLASAASGQSYRILKSFAGGSDGQTPRAGLALAGSTLYGTTDSGGTSNLGVVFKVNTDGSGYSVLKSFTGRDGWMPYAALLVSGSTLYGTTVRGGSADIGVVFKMNTDGSSYSVIKSFTGMDGGYPWSGLVLAGGMLYGTAQSTLSRGVVFKLYTDGSGFTVLKSFTGADGGTPYASLVLEGGTLYGTTYDGGASNLGAIFKLNTDGSGYAMLKSFTGGDGAGPQAGLALSDSTLYGTTEFNAGVVFKLNTDGSGYRVLKNFNGSSEWTPWAGLLLADGTLYGTTYAGGSSRCGAVFKVNTDGSGYTVVKNLADSEGSFPQAGLIADHNVLYGTTTAGGSWNRGVVFSLAGVMPTNRPPVAGTPFTKIIGDEVAEIPAYRFLLWCSDPDNDPLNLTAVTSPSAMGAVVTLETNRVSYAPPPGFLGDDTFGFTITDGNSGFASGTASILVEPRRLAAATMLPPITSLGALQLNFTGFAGLGYTVERAESLEGPWTAIGNVLADDNGTASFTDRNPPAGNAFYRAVHY